MRRASDFRGHRRRSRGTVPCVSNEADAAGLMMRQEEGATEVPRRERGPRSASMRRKGPDHERFGVRSCDLRSRAMAPDEPPITPAGDALQLFLRRWTI